MSTKSTSERLLSLDALRGFDMFWISGGGKFFHVLANVTGWGGAVWFAQQLEHPDWHGFKVYDLIFPLFIFMAGVSTPYSIGGRLAKGDSKSELAMKAMKRAAILILLGIIVNNGIFRTPIDDWRIASVLGRIGLAGMFAQLIYIYFQPKAQWMWCGGILVGYWLFMAYFPVPGCGAGLLTMECNPASYIDTLLLPGKLYKRIHDPEGLISTLPAICNALFGIFAGGVLKSVLSDKDKLARLVAAGIICVAVALVWDTVFPINKNIWTSSFVLLTVGWSFLLLALFYGIIDVLKIRKWTLFFIVIGMNSIVIYMIDDFIDFGYTANALFGGLLSFLPEDWAAIGKPVTYIAVLWAFMYYLYKKKLFLKV